MDKDAEILISFAIPCYNVADYVDHCVESILAGTRGYHDRVEVILVDDGSAKDDTPQIIDSWQERHPTVIKAIHQPNGGHGQAVNTGLRNARGHYFKVVDADDWLDEASAQKVMELIAGFMDGAEEAQEGGLFPRPAQQVDLIIANYVYEKADEGKQTVIRYTRVLPKERVVGWDAVGKFKAYQYILMHSVIYRTEVLRAARLELPAHTFYVDNIFVYVPLPSVQTLYYLNVDLYRYFIGREGQSVNEAVMASRIEQQLKITRVMIDAVKLDKQVESPHLRAYMTNYLTMMMVICSVFLLLSKREDAVEQRDAIWAYLKERNPGAYERMQRGVLARGVRLNGRIGHAITIAGYRMAQKVFKFN